MTEVTLQCGRDNRRKRLFGVDRVMFDLAQEPGRHVDVELLDVAISGVPHCYDASITWCLSSPGRLSGVIILRRLIVPGAILGAVFIGLFAVTLQAIFVQRHLAGVVVAAALIAVAWSVNRTAPPLSPYAGSTVQRAIGTPTNQGEPYGRVRIESMAVAHPHWV